MSQKTPAIVWFRHDLRLADNPALHAAVETGKPLTLLYILEEGSDVRPHGGASLWWLDKSLRALRAQIETHGGALTLRRGRAADIVPEIASSTEADAVYWNRRYDQAGRSVDADLKLALNENGLTAQSFNGSLLTEPWTVKTGSGGYYKVFTPYWKSVRANYSAPAPIPEPGPSALAGPNVASDTLDDWDLHPQNPDWSEGFVPVWTPGEAGAQARLGSFLNGPANRYGADRNRPDIEDGTSGLSPHLRWGEISPVHIWRTVKDGMAAGRLDEENAMVFLSEIVWREFAYVLLYHNPDLADDNYNDDFQHMPWRDNEEDYRRWCRGQTGYPIVDAGMRQLWHTGWMHNRVRMIVGSFLTKHLLIHWSRGEDWFWDTLVDADPASNAASWQWVAGSGADAAPYFRVFNPITQGEKFDETGDYVRHWCPEIAALPDKHLFSPWSAPQSVLDTYKIQLGTTYPAPMIDHKDGRQRALDAYDILKKKREAA
ncbi:MAG: deoxyribodipyrimidine photo-lyase [Pseudomonadota bacterium]